MTRDNAVRLTLPADADLASVVVAALGAIARSAGIPGEQVEQVRERAAMAFAEAIEHGEGDAIEVVARARPRRRECSFELRRIDSAQPH